MNLNYDVHGVFGIDLWCFISAMCRYWQITSIAEYDIFKEASLDHLLPGRGRFTTCVFEIT